MAEQKTGYVRGFCRSSHHLPRNHSFLQRYVLLSQQDVLLSLPSGQDNDILSQQPNDIQGHREGAEVIVMEHLSITGKIKGSKAQKITLWRKREIQHRVEELAARSGIRVTYIFASRTSKYAFDGSGLVERDKNNYSMCTFATGKRYNCDLSASYNIGARFFIRVLLKTMPAKVRLQAEAKVPSARTRTTCTLSTLISLCTVLMGLPVNTETDRTGRRAVPTV